MYSIRESVKLSANKSVKQTSNFSVTRPEAIGPTAAVAEKLGGKEANCKLLDG